jgi:hypothetical protein
MCPAVERFHNVYRIGGRGPAVVGRTPRADRETAARADSDSMPRIGLWRVRDHSATIAALCGPWGRL